MTTKSKRKESKTLPLQGVLEIDGLSIVAVGSFNPAIFQPAWFAHHNLITQADADDANIRFVGKPASLFSTEWFEFQTTTTRFSIEISDSSKGLPLCDLVRNTFKILEHTPISAFGFNSNRHFRLLSKGDFRAFGDLLADKKQWKPILNDPGLILLTMQGKRSHVDARIQIRIESSAKFEFGVFLGINQQWDAPPDNDNIERLAVFMKHLASDSWNDFFQKYANNVSDQFLCCS